MKAACRSLAAALCLCLCLCAAGPEAGRDPLIRARQALDGILRRMDRSLAAVAVGLSEQGLTGAAARESLRRLCQDYPEAVDCAAVDAQGVMRTVEPGGYAKFEGADIGKQEQVVLLHGTKKPVLSKVFRSVEGFDAVDLEHPVFSADGRLAGSASMLIRPRTLLASVLSPLPQDGSLRLQVMQGDGLILYDSRQGEDGGKLFQEPLLQASPQALEVDRRIRAEQSGTAGYALRAAAGRIVKMTVRWDSAGLHGTQWRLILTRAAP